MVDICSVNAGPFDFELFGLDDLLLREIPYAARNGLHFLHVLMELSFIEEVVGLSPSKILPILI